MPGRPRLPPAAPGESRTQRHARRTKAFIEGAFVELVLEKGYEKVSIEDITVRADIARATFYAHYPNKEALLRAVFSQLVNDLMERIAYRSGPWSEVRRDAVETAYRHAAEMPDLYRACLSDAWAREAYLSALTQYTEQNFRDRLKALKRQPRIPVFIMARGFAGAHVAILESWLAGQIDASAEELANQALDLLIAGTAWAHDVDLVALGYSTGTSRSRIPGRKKSSERGSTGR